MILPEENIAELFRLADVVLFPSHREGFGIPVLEAGLGRVPVFAADIPTVQESGNGLVEVFDPSGNPHDAAHKIISFLESDRAYQLRRHVFENFSWQSILRNRIIPLLKEFKPLNE